MEALARPYGLARLRRYLSAASGVEPLEGEADLSECGAPRVKGATV